MAPRAVGRASESARAFYAVGSSGGRCIARSIGAPDLCEAAPLYVCRHASPVGDRARVPAVTLADDEFAILLRAARAIDDDDVRGNFFAAVADQLRPHGLIKE